MGGAVVVQPSFEELGTPLWEVTFVVIDLETTGLDPRRDRITEVGAVKVRGGERLGEFHALVAPGVPIPPGVARLTGITDATVARCPPIEAIVPALAEFLRGTTVVAHNARFDLSFLRTAFGALSYPPLDNPVVDTARLARRVLPRDEVRDVRLSTLAHHLRARVKPEHRALADARATVDVLHALLERVGSLGVTTLEELRDHTRSTSDATYRRIRLVDGAPEAPGTYRFIGHDGEVIYVGKAVCLRERLRQYFGQDPRRRIADLVRGTAEVTWEIAPTELEAAVRELRAIHQHRPRYNRRSRHPERAVYVKLTRERFPRLSIVTSVRDTDALHVGPLPSRRHAEDLRDAIHDVIPLRQCTDRLTTRGRPACSLKELGRCGAPCDGTQSDDAYDEVVSRYVDAVEGDPRELLQGLRARMLERARNGRFEQARAARDRLHHAATTLARIRRLRLLVGVDELVAARPAGDDTEVVLVRRGRLSGTARCPREEVEAAVDGLRSTAPPAPPAGLPPGTDLEEIDLVATWLQRPGVALLAVEGVLAEPVAGGAALATTVAEATRVRRVLRRDRQLATGTKVVRRSA